MPIKYYGQYIACDTEAEVLALVGKAGDVAFAVDSGLRYMYNGSIWYPTDTVRVLRGNLSSVNLMATGTTKILTIPTTSFRFVPLGIHSEVLTLTGTIVTQANVSVGATATAYTDIAAAQLLSGSLLSLGLTSTNALTIASARSALAGATDIFVKVNAAAIGPSVYTAQFDILGYFKA